MKATPMPTKIGGFTKYEIKPNAIRYGTLYTRRMKMDVPNEQMRTLRVYLPEDYDPNKQYPVMYMCDAQNMVDRYTSAYGEWDIDEHMHALIKQGYQSFITVGFDCPKNPLNRIKEYTLSKTRFGNRKVRNTHGYGEKYAKYMIKTIKPLIDKAFSTDPSQEATAFGGSSMGGLCAFDMVSLYPEIFGFALSFSPAFFLLFAGEYKKEIDERKIPQNKQKYFFFTGGSDLDAQILPGTLKMYRYMKKIGFDNDHAALIIDTEKGHCEASWSAYFQDAIKFWQKNKEN